MLGLLLVDQLELLASMVNFGALMGFLLLHLSVIAHFMVRGKSRRWVRHLVVPVIGFAVVAYVLANAGTPAKVAGVCWLGVGVVALAVIRFRGGRT